MKFSSFLLTAFACLTFSFVSCKKEGSAVENPNTITPGDSSYLSVIYDIYKNGSVSDTDASMIYSYDASKRVIKLKDSAWHPTFDYRTATTVYFYQGNDTLPYKSTQTTVWYAAKPDQVINSFYYYNTAGLRIKDSVITPSNHYVALQQYLPGKIVSSRVDSFFSAPTYNYYYTETRKDTAIQDVSGNVISNVSRRGTAYVYQSTVTYDNHPSPFIKLSNSKTLALFPTGETLVMEMPQTNNRLKILETSSLHGQTPIVQYNNDLTGKYIYKANGYPAQITITDPATGEINIVVFTYTAL